MTISIPKSLEGFISQQIQSGEHRDVESVVTRALLAMRDAKLPTADSISSLRAMLKEGIDDLDAGRSSEWNVEEIKAEGRRMLEQSRRQSGE